MTELKTLKDIDSGKLYNKDCEFNYVFVDELKAEAVKWAKGLKTIDLCQYAIHIWIIDFFNLTEGDLK